MGEEVLGVQVLDELPGGIEGEERLAHVRRECVGAVAEQGVVGERGRVKLS
jgi:hypothetical protein